MRGFDSSAVNDSDAGTYYDAGGSESDIFSILPDYGVNYVRLRVWNNPSSSNPEVPGASDKDVLVEQAKRVKSNGLNLLVDFHYSDYWADPGKQVIPSDWSSVSTSDDMATKITEYTKEVLNALVEAGATPNMIQIGNEISSGILKHSKIEISNNTTTTTDAGTAVAGIFKSSNYYKYLAAGIKAAREVCPNAKIMLHFTDIGSNAPSSYLSEFATAFASASVDYDVVGLSWYYNESSHGTLASLGEEISKIKKTYGKEVVVVETNFYYASEKGYDKDNTCRLVGSDGKVYSGIDVTDDGYVVNSVQNQANVIRAIIEVAASSGASGVFEWGGEYQGNWNSMFYSSGKPLPSLGVFSVSGN